MRFQHVFAVLITCCVTFPSFGQRMSDFACPRPLPKGSTLVIGFVGGWKPFDERVSGVRRLALRLRQTPGVFADTCENHKRARALALVKQALDADCDGAISSVEARRVNIILYGQSMGGGAALKLARELRQWSVPVALTIQVDSFGFSDGLVPTNVATAVNLYQSEPFTIRGQNRIRAEDPTRTRILENRRFDYPFFGGPRAPSFIRRAFGGAHAKMEADPAVWTLVERYIMEAISPVGPS
ncbi:MAG TPA: hypothetical protein VE621_10965 [Bryobacteraceae bacterium]|nr:hypothetical protein [Bryobacteraceae bacterium]